MFKAHRFILASLKNLSTVLLLASALLGASAGPVLGQDAWTGNGTIGSWNDPRNWSAGVPTTGTDVALTGGGGNPPLNYNIPVAIQLNSISLNNPAPILGYLIGLTGVTPGLVSGGKITDNSNRVADFIATGLTLNGPATITGNQASAFRTLTFITNPITGTGPLTLAATSSPIILGTVNTYTGATIIDTGLRLGVNAAVDGAVPTTSALIVNAGGSIQFFSSSTIGSLAGAGEVGLNRAFSSINLTVGADNTSTTFSGVIDDVFGRNSLTKIGDGTLTLTGTNTYAGPTTISEGTLVVNGSIASSSLTTANAGGTLAGTGSVGATTVNGTIAPGPVGGVGTLNVAGNFTQAAGSNFLVNLAGPASSRLQITGPATLQGGTVVAAGNGTAGSTYLILSATGGLTGTFAGVTGNLPFLTPVLVYDPENVFLTVRPAFPGTPNEREEIAALTPVSGTPAFSSLFTALARETPDQVRFTVDQLDGEAYASAVSAGIENQALWLRTIAQHVRLANTRLCPETAACDGSGCGANSGWHAWATPFGQAGANQGDGDAHGFTYDSVGFAAGGDRRIGDAGNGMVGLATGYSNWGTHTHSINDSINANAFNLAGYARADIGNAWLLGIVSYEYDGYSSARPLTFLGSTARGAFSGNQFGSYLEVGYSLDLGCLRVQPLGSLQYISLWRDRVSETGAGAEDLNVAGARADSFRGQLGSRMLFPITTGCILAELGAYWIHEYAQDKREDVNSFAGGGAAFLTEGGNLGRDFGLFTAGVSAQMGSSMVARLYYLNYVSPSAVANGGMAEVQLMW
jgi:autotransporter-associated beta strand protein